MYRYVLYIKENDQQGNGDNAAGPPRLRILLVAKCSGESIKPTILSNILLRQLFSEKTDFDRGKLLARI